MHISVIFLRRPQVTSALQSLQLGTRAVWEFECNTGRWCKFKHRVSSQFCWPSWNRFGQNIWTKKSKACKTEMKPSSLRTEGRLNWMLSGQSGHWVGLSAKPHRQNVVSGVGAELHAGLCRFPHYIFWTLSIRDNINCIWHVDTSFPCHICVKIRDFFSFLRIAMKQINATRGTRKVRRVLVWAFEMIPKSWNRKTWVMRVENDKDQQLKLRSCPADT